MQIHYSKRLRMTFAVLTAVIFTVIKLWNTPLEITVSVVLIALPIPILFGVVCYWILGIERKPGVTPLKNRIQQNMEKESKQDWAYEKATIELENNTIEKAIWARAFSDCDGNDARTKAVYIRLRVERLLSEEAAVKKIVYEESEESIRSRAKIKSLYTGIFFALLIAIATFILVTKESHKKVGVVLLPTDGITFDQATASLLPPDASDCLDPLSWINGKVQLTEYSEIESYFQKQKCNVYTKFIDPPTNKNSILEIIINDSYRNMPKAERVSLTAPLLQRDNDFQKLSPNARKIIREMLLIGEGFWPY